KDESDETKDEITDKDGDGIADIIDPDNQDGPKGDIDGDGIANANDPDADNDGVNNADEKAAGTNPLNKDTDGDGTPDGEEDADNDGILNKDESDVPAGPVDDVDGDGLGDTTITDKNGNGIADIVDPTWPNSDTGSSKPGDNAGSSKTGDDGLSPGAIAGIITGVLGAILLLLNIPQIVAFFQGIFLVPAPTPKKEEPMKPGLKKGISKGKGIMK
ncbi:hypothetical protein NXT01_08490, partial [Corynebacterium sp. ES2775-CONJ]|nr:hypothetical protein [Corynebacterium sp. ES2775-CONJ]